MPKAMRFHKQGGPEVLQLDEVALAEPGPGQARVRHTAIGVNFVDVYQRSGLYPMQVPQVAGNEGAGQEQQRGPNEPGNGKAGPEKTNPDKTGPDQTGADKTGAAQ